MQLAQPSIMTCIHLANTLSFQAMIARQEESFFVQNDRFREGACNPRGGLVPKRYLLGRGRCSDAARMLPGPSLL